MKKYVKPTAELVEFNSVDILTSSSGFDLPEIPISDGGIELPGIPLDKNKLSTY
jgi:hypothetical protein